MKEPTMGLLEELAVRCEAATVADRELDCLIWAKITDQKVVWTGGDGHLLVIGGSAIGSIDPGKHSRNFSCNRQAIGPGSIPAYTASIDAAMSLVPDGWRVELEQHTQCWTATLADKPWFDDARKVEDGSAQTAALTIVAASLRARHALALSKEPTTQPS